MTRFVNKIHFGRRSEVNLLAIETSTLVGSVAIMQNGQLAYEQVLGIREDHSSRLMPAVDDALRHVGWSPRDVDVYALAIGPGSFTSLRVGLATVKGLCMATGAAVVAVPTLDVMALAFMGCRWRVCPMLDARMNEVYGAVYEWREEGQNKLTPDRVASVEDILAGWENSPVVCFGSGAELYRERIEKTLGDNCRFVDRSFGLPRASRVAVAATKRFALGETDDIDLLEPVYLRKSEAERARDRRARNS